MAELMYSNPFESFNRGAMQGAQNALMRREMDFQKRRPELIQNALRTGNTQEVFAERPELGLQVQEFLGALGEQERAEFKQRHDASAKLLAFVESLPPEQRPGAYQQVAPQINSLWGQEVMPPQYDPVGVGMALAQARDIDDILKPVKSGSQYRPLTDKEIVARGLDTSRGYQIDTSTGKVEALPGSAREAESAQDKKTLRAKQQIAAIDNTFTAIDKALEEVGWTTAGPIGAFLEDIPGTAAADLRKTVLTIKANIGFDRLQQMREASPTGGALGQVSNQEIDALQSTIANLDLSQTPQQLAENLKKVREHYENWKRVIQQSMGGDETPDPLGIRY